MNIIEQIEQAELRWDKSATSREKVLHELDKIRHGEKPDWAQLDERSRYQTRLQRLGQMKAAETLANTPVTDDSVIGFNPLERILGSNEIMGVQFLERGLIAARAVARVSIGHSSGGISGHGTGFLISPRLFMTNNHVIDNEDIARTSFIEFEYLTSMTGPRDPIVYQFDPDTFFQTDESLDFTIIAVEANNALGYSLKERGWCPLIEGSGKAVKGERVNIIHHPHGERMKLTIRDNTILNVVDDFLHYKADTLPGSSGSPIFNEQFELAALHHAGVPERDSSRRILTIGGQPWQTNDDPDQISWIANEGTRISRIVAHVKRQNISHHQQQLWNDAFSPPRSTELWDLLGKNSLTNVEPQENIPVVQHTDNNGQSSWLFRLSFGPVSELQPPTLAGARPQLPPRQPEQRMVMPAQPQVSAPVAEANKEPVHDSNYNNRPGYQIDFLGIPVPLPIVTNFQIVSKMDSGEHVLPYYHFSLVQHKERRLALFTAANIDASPSAKEPEPGRNYSRKGLNGFGRNDREKWFTDPRIPELHQLPDRFYNLDRQAFNKGHIVRRVAVAWGKTYREVQFSNGDTFHATNCSPQVADFNQSRLRGEWGQLENFILDQADTKRLNIFAGPVLAPDDPIFQGVDDQSNISVKIPKDYWKVVISRSGNKLQSFAFLLEQDLSDVDFEFTVNSTWRSRMVSLSELDGRLSGFRFPEEILRADQFGLDSGNEISKHL